MTPRDSQRQALEAAVRELDRRIGANRSEFTKMQADQAQEVSRASSRISDVECKAREKERNSSSSSLPGCLMVLAAVAAFIAGVIRYNVSTFQMPEAARTERYGVLDTVLLICLAAFVIGLFWKPVVRYFTATLPASNIRSELPTLRRDLEQVKLESEARLNQEAAKFEAELQRLKQQKEQCQQELAKI